MTLGGYAQTARLVDADRLRAMLIALREEVRGFEPPDEPDSVLVEHVERPFESVSEASDRLSQLEASLRERSDRRAVFLTIYVRMTREVHDGLEDGAFADPEWMRRYLVTFANYYRRAFLAFERGEVGAVPDPWRIAFGSAVRGDALVVQDAFLGVNAHINYDLALTLTDVGIDPDRSRKYADHRAINEILERLVDAQQRALAEVYASGVGDVDLAFGRLDESFSLLSMTEGREQAWRVAVVMTDVDVPPISSYARWVLRATATGAAMFVLGPRLDPSLQRRLRRVETEGVGLEAILERARESVQQATLPGPGGGRDRK